MTRYKIDSLDFDVTERTLSLKTQVRVLEPRSVALLQVLLEAEGKLVSRDTLIEKVWLGRVVGESAINRSVSLLRRHFEHLDNGRKYIETLSKSGYKFVFPSQRMQPEVNLNPLLDPISDSKLLGITTVKSYGMALFALLLLFGMSIWLYETITPHSVKPNAVKPAAHGADTQLITSLTGVEYNISADKSGRRLVFHRRTKQADKYIYQLWLVDAGNPRGRLLISAEDVIASAQISPSGDQLIYARYDGLKCSVQWLDIVSQQNKSLFDCAADAKPTFSWGNESNAFFYRTRTDKTQPFTVYHYHLHTQRHSQVTQPFSGGNKPGDYLLAHHPSQDKLAIVRYVDHSRSDIQIINSKTYALLNHYPLNAEIRFIQWHPSQEWLLYAQDEKVMRINLQQQTNTLLLDTGKAIQSFALTNNNSGDRLQLYLSEYQSNSHIWRQALTSNTAPERWLNSSRQETLPKAANTSSQLMFLSNRTGAYQFYVSDKNNNVDPLSISLPLTFMGFDWSPQDKRLVFYHDERFYLYDLASKHLQPILDKQDDSYVINFADNEQEIIYSSHKTGQWQLWNHNLMTGKERKITHNGGYRGRIWRSQLVFSKFNHHGLWLKSLDGKDEQLLLEDFDLTNWLNWHIRGDNLYYYDPKTGVWRYNLETKQRQLMLTTGVDFLAQFSVSADESFIYYVQKEPDQGDIYRLSL